LAYPPLHALLKFMAAPSLPPAPLSSGVVPQWGDASLFPHLAYRAFFAHAAIAPLNELGRRAMDHYAVSLGQWGNGAFPMWMAQRERLRETLARMLGVQPHQVGLSSGCSHSITDVALALPWSSGQVLLSFEGEFPANVVPYQQAAHAAGGHVRLLPMPPADSPSAAEDILQAVEDALKAPYERVAHLAVSAVQFQTGLRMPLAGLGELCDRYDVTFLVDGIQACGVLPLNLAELGVDAFFTGAHKWLLGVEGAGASVLSQDLAHRLAPRTAGWLSRECGADFLFKGPGLLRYDQPYLPAPRVFEGSTANAAGLAALEAGVDILMHLGPAHIYAYVQRLHDYIEPLLIERRFVSLRSPDVDLRSCILSFRPPDGVDVCALFEGLEARGVRVSIPDGVLRLAPHYYNTRAHADVLVSALDEILGR